MEQKHHREPLFDDAKTLEVRNLFRDWMGKHITPDSDSKISLLEDDPSKYPFQSLDRVLIPPSPLASIESVRQTSEFIIGSSFGQLVDDIRAHEEDLALYKKVLAEGKSIAPITNHEELINNALVQAALLCAADDESLIDKNVILLNNMISYMGFEVGLKDPMPAIEVLRGMGSIIKVVPRTTSALSAGLSDEIASPMNRRMLSELRQFIRKGMVMGIAPSGTTDKVVVTEKGEEEILMQRATDSTVKLISHCAYIWPFETDFTNPKQRRWNIKNIQEVTQDADVHIALHEIAESHTEGRGIYTRYETAGEANARMQEEKKKAEAIAAALASTALG